MPPQPTEHIKLRRSDNVRIGPVSLITLIIVVCLAVMGVLTASTSHASSVISQRYADATVGMYQNELAGQQFLAELDDALDRVRRAKGSASDGAWAVEAQLDALCAAARTAGGEGVACTAQVQDQQLSATFTCNDARTLDIVVTILDDGAYRVDQWKMASVQQEPASVGTLWTGA